MAKNADPGRTRHRGRCSRVPHQCHRSSATIDEADTGVGRGAGRAPGPRYRRRTAPHPVAQHCRHRGGRTRGVDRPAPARARRAAACARARGRVRIACGARSAREGYAFSARLDGPVAALVEVLHHRLGRVLGSLSKVLAAVGVHPRKSPGARVGNRAAGAAAAIRLGGSGVGAR